MEILEVKLMRRLDIFRTIPYQWKREHPGLCLLSLKQGNKIRFSRWVAYFAWVYVVCIILQVIFLWNSSNLLNQMLGVGGIGAFVAGLPCVTVGNFKGHRLVALFNNLVKLERRTKSRNSAVTEVSCSTPPKTPAVHLLSGTPFLAVLTGVSQLAKPCSSTRLGTFLLRSCSSGAPGVPPKLPRTPGVLAMRMTMGISVFLAYGTLAPNFASVGRILVLQGQLIRASLENLGVALGRQKKLNKADSTFQHFREIQLLLNEFRAIYSKDVLVGLALGIFLGQIACLYISLHFLAEGNVLRHLPLFIATAFVITPTLIVLVSVFDCLGGVYETTEETKRYIKRNGQLMSSRRMRQWIRSIPYLRIHFATNNFVDPQTALNIENMVVEQTVSLLILQ